MILPAQLSVRVHLICQLNPLPQPSARHYLQELNIFENVIFSFTINNNNNTIIDQFDDTTSTFNRLWRLSLMFYEAAAATKNKRKKSWWDRLFSRLQGVFNSFFVPSYGWNMKQFYKNLIKIKMFQKKSLNFL